MKSGGADDDVVVFDDVAAAVKAVQHHVATALKEMNHGIAPHVARDGSILVVDPDAGAGRSTVV